MTGSGHDLAVLLDAQSCTTATGGPLTPRWVAPRSIDQAAAVMRAATDNDKRVLIWGGGTHQGHGYPIEADIVLSTHRLSEVVDWQPDDLTVVVEAGVKVADLEAMLAERGQTAVLLEATRGATVGGTIAAGVSAWRRLRYGPTRDRVLETVMATGDGRVVRAGGPLVKNVTGYDVARLVTGSYGSLGVIGQVCLKLWPTGVSICGCAGCRRRCGLEGSVSPARRHRDRDEIPSPISQGLPRRSPPRLRPWAERLSMILDGPALSTVPGDW